MIQKTENASLQHSPTSKLRSKNGWSRADFSTAKIISNYGGSGIEILLNKLELASNETLRRDLTTFVDKFSKFRTFKEVIKCVND